MTRTLETALANAAMHPVLAVDDEEIVLFALGETLQREGYKVVTCSNAVEALSVLEQQPFSVIISDQCMPMITGLELFAQAKEIQPDATRILITAVLSLRTVMDAINKGEIYRFVVKPWLREDLLTTVRNAVQRYELICKNLVLQATTRAMNEQLMNSNRTLDEQVARAMEQNQRLEQFTSMLERNLERAVELSARLLQSCQPALAEKAPRVYELCRAMAAQLKLPRSQRLALEVSAWLHDIGLIQLPRDLVERWLKSPESLTAEETALIEHHPLKSEALMSFDDALEEIGPIVRAHHERWDGHGYPDRLKAEEIPWLARLLSVAVFFVHSAQDQNTTMELVERGGGSTFDPAAVRVLLRCMTGVAAES